MKLAEKVLQKLEPVSIQGMFDAFEEKISSFGIEGLSIEDIEVDYDGFISVIFSDDEGDELEVIFMYDEEYGSVAMMSDSDSDRDEDEVIMVELDSLDPTLVQTPYGKFINLSELSWMNKSTLITILSAGDLLDDEEMEEEDSEMLPDPYGYILKEENEVVEIEERKVMVVRGGKRVRLPVTRKKRRKILTGKQRASFRKAARKRKAKMSRIVRKRKKSLKIRRRTGLKTPKLSRFQKVAGTANRKR